MIPDHLIDQAAAAIYAATAFGDEFALDAWHDMNDDNPIKTTTRMYARAALETVAADIWDEGWSQGMAYVVGMERGTDDDHTTANPYRTQETA